MARFLFLTWGGAGNQTPAIGLAAALAGRGHTVTFAGYPEQARRFTGFGFRVLPRARHAWPSAPPADWMPVLADAVWACPEHLGDVPDLVADEGCDVLVVDCLMFGALAAAERLTVPAAVLVHSAPGALVPPGGGMDLLALERVNRIRASAGEAPLSALWDAWRPFVTLCTSVPELDPLSDRLPAEFGFVGPVAEPDDGAGWQSPWPAGDPRPLALVSFSTGQAWDQRSRIQRTLDALDDGGYRVLVTTGLAGIDEVTVPGDAVLVPFVPHASVLPHAAITVTHAGHGTVAASLAYGVPVVALPNPAADQPILAQQVAKLGAGIALDGESATPGEIADACRRVLADGEYAAAARHMEEAIAGYPSDGGAEQLEVAITSPVASVRRTRPV
jgi:UDP:flavonoid glycosyltransferase YjiC (YdhE family)